MPIEIIIRESGTEGVTNNGVPQADPNFLQEQGVENSNQKQVNTLLIDYGKQIIQNGVDAYIDYTGNYILSNKIQSGISFAANALMAVKGGTVGRIAVAFNAVNNIIKTSKEVSRANQRVDFIKNQAGKIVEMGGRYTND